MLFLFYCLQAGNNMQIINSYGNVTLRYHSTFGYHLLIPMLCPFSTLFFLRVANFHTLTHAFIFWALLAISLI